MTVAYTDRTVPLAANGNNTLAAAIRLAYDFTGLGSLAVGAPYISAAAASLSAVGTMNALTLNGIPGRSPSNASGYQFSGNGSTDFGTNIGTGDVTVLALVSTGSSLPAATAAMQLVQIDNAGASAVMSLSWNEISTGWYVSASPAGTSLTNVVFSPDKTVLVAWRRISGVASVWVAEVGASATPTKRYDDVANTTNWDSTSAKRIRVGYNSGATALSKSTINNVKVLAYGLSNAELQTIARDPWVLDANAAVADTLTITSPATNATVASTTTISGTYTGTAPTSVQVQHGAGAWTTLTGFVATPATGSAGTWSGSVVLSPAAAASLRARNAANTGVVSADVTGITVIANSIAFTTPMVPFTTTPDTQNGAVNYRLFQQDASGQSTARVTGTYIGSPTAIEWRFNGGAWATLVASPAGGTFDATVSLQGPAQGALEVRFANNTSVSAALTAVGVGELYISSGQSNDVGKSTSYIPPVAPTANPTWVSVERDKTGVWRPHTESALQPFDAVAAGTAIYAVHETSGSYAGLGSYFGQLATLRMADGVPVGFVPCALGSSSLAAWAPNTATSSLYGAFAATATAVGNFKGVIHWQGEAEALSAATSQATQEAGLNAIINDFATKFPGKQFILININTAGVDATGAATVRKAIAKVARTNPAVKGYADMLGTFSNSVHYGTGGNSEVLAVAAEAYKAITLGAPVGMTKVSDLTQSGTAGAALSSSVVGCFASSFRPTGYAVTSGSLAPLTLDATTGAITGTPSAAGQLTAVVTATDLSGATATATVTVNVAAAADTTPPSWPAGVSIAITGLGQTSYTATAPDASDNVAVTAYRYRVNAGTWQSGQVAPITGRTPGSTDTVEFQASDVVGNWSTSLSRAVTLQPAGATDTTAPTLSSPSGTATGATSATLSVNTNEGNGTLRAVVTSAATTPSVAQVKAGLSAAGTAAVWAGNASVAGVGVQSLVAAGLAPSTTYYAHFVHTDAVGNDSAVASSSAFTTQAASTGGTSAGWSEVLANGLTASQTLIEVHTMLTELSKINGLRAGSPLTVTSTQRSAGGITQSIAESSSGTITVTRTS